MQRDQERQPEGVVSRIQDGMPTCIGGQLILRLDMSVSFESNRVESPSNGKHTLRRIQEDI
jgi:hypothetical protein